MANISKRSHIIEALYELFKSNGFFSTSMEELISASSVSRRTMYNHFTSKNKLVVAVIHYYTEDYAKNLENLFVKKKIVQPLSKLQTMFEYSLTKYKNKSFHGCIAVHAMNEYTNKDDEIINACQIFKDKQLEMITAFAKQSKLKNPKTIAYELFVVLEGLTVIAGRSKKTPKNNPKNLFRKIIEE